MNDARPHPGPLPQEREKRALLIGVPTMSRNSLAHSSESSAGGGSPINSQAISDALKLFPLPGGEGQGEGERSTKYFLFAHGAFSALRKHWPEYLIEGACLGIFMISAGVFTALFEYPNSPAHQAIASPDLRRALIGIAMGLTAVGLIYSPWGRQSGAHMNPAVTLTFFRLGKVPLWDAAFYIAAQFIGGLLGVLLTKAALGMYFTHPTVNYVVTVPGSAGMTVAFMGEALIAGGMMLMILLATNTPKLARWTGMFAGTLVALYITFEAPYSGMSINPARTVASALPSGVWTAGWIYFVAPIGGMLLAVEIYRALRNGAQVACAKLNHDLRHRCIFCGHSGSEKTVSPGPKRLKQPESQDKTL